MRFRPTLSEAELTRKNRARTSTRPQADLPYNYGNNPHIMELFGLHHPYGPAFAPDQITYARQNGSAALFRDKIFHPPCIDSRNLCGEDTDGRFSENSNALPSGN